MENLRKSAHKPDLIGDEFVHTIQLPYNENANALF